MTDRLRILDTEATREEELNDRLGGDLLFPFWSNLAHGTEKELTSAAEVSHDCAQPLGIDVRVAGGCCDTLMGQERLDVAQVGSALVARQRADARK